VAPVLRARAISAAFVQSVYLFSGALSVFLTVQTLLAASGDKRIWLSRVPGVGSLVIAYSLVLVANLFVLLLAYWTSLKGLNHVDCRVLWGAVLAYLPVLVAALFIDGQYNYIDRFFLDKRRPEVYVIANPNVGRDLNELLSRSDVGPDLRTLLRNSGFLASLPHLRFYKQDFDEPFQVLQKSVILGYKTNAGSRSEGAPFTIVRFPRAIADVLSLMPE
jgi:hypothetical protein